MIASRRFLTSLIASATTKPVTTAATAIATSPISSSGSRRSTARTLARDGAGSYSRLVKIQAEARLLAARQLMTQGRRTEADAQLERALVFFRSVRATPYVQAAESLLAATA